MMIPQCRCQGTGLTTLVARGLEGRRGGARTRALMPRSAVDEVEEHDTRTRARWKVREQSMYTITMKHAVPVASRVLINTTRKVDYVDSFRVALPLGEELSVDYLCAKVFSAMPWWIDVLFVVRNVLVAAFGLKKGDGGAPRQVTRDIHFEPGCRDCYFDVIDRTRDEIVMGEGDKHLDFRVSVRKSEVPNCVTIFELTTVVWYNNWLGPIYFTVVKPFHRALISSMMNRASGRLVREHGSEAEGEEARA
jgi:hypothetical protein